MSCAGYAAGYSDNNLSSLFTIFILLSGQVKFIYENTGALYFQPAWPSIHNRAWDKNRQAPD